MSVTLSVRDFLRGFAEYSHQLSSGVLEKIIVQDKNKHEVFVFQKEKSKEEQKKEMIAQLRKKPLLPENFELERVLPNTLEDFFTREK